MKPRQPRSPRRSARTKSVAPHRGDERVAALRSKYGVAAVDRGVQLEPERFIRRLEFFDRLDQHFAKLIVDYGYAGLGRRTVLDERTRLLVLSGQLAMRKNQAALRDTIRAALDQRIPARDVLEVLIQCQLYGGTDITEPALETFASIADEDGLWEELRETQLPIDGRDGDRNLEDERRRWDPADAADPRLAPLLERHGWRGISAGLLERPGHHLNLLEYTDALDPSFATIWVNFTYGGLYSRRVLDEKTRLLCMVGDCIAAGEEVQGRAHMGSALRAGAEPRELLEIVLLSSFYLGQPTKVNFLRVFVELVASLGRSAEIGDPPQPVR